MANDDRRQYLARSYTHAADIASRIRPDQLADPTPCAEYDVAGLIDHIVGAGWRAAEMGRGVNPSGDEFPHVELSDAPDQLRQAGKEADAAWSDDARLDATVTMPWGETSDGYTLVDMDLAEITGHTWDLASASGQLDRLDPDLAPVALGGARAMLKPEYRDAMGKGNPFGAEVEPPADASDWEKLAAFLGRKPRS